MDKKNVQAYISSRDLLYLIPVADLQFFYGGWYVDNKELLIGILIKKQLRDDKKFNLFFGSCSLLQ